MNEKIGFGEKFAFALGPFGQNMIIGFTTVYIMFFFTDLLGIPVAVATMVMTLASLWDAINDPIMGLISDRTRTKWGKFRPYLIFGPVLVAIATILCFTKFNFSPTATVIVAAICYVLWGMTYTVCDIPMWGMSSLISNDTAEKTKMITLAKVFGVTGSIMIGIFAMILINAFGGPRNATSYTYSAIIITVIGACLMIFMGLKVKERVVLSKEQIPFRHSIKTITKNKFMVFLIVMILLINLCLTLRAAVGMYNAMYVLANPSAMSVLGIATAGGMIIGMMFTPMLTRKMSNKKVLTVFCLLGALMGVSPYIIDPTNLIVVLVFNLLHNMCNGILMVTSSAMLLDMIDLSENKLGFRGDGVAFSTNTFITKLASTFSKLIAGVGMMLVSYTEGQGATGPIINAFSTMSYVIPAICLLLILVPLHFYKYTEKDKAETLAQLAIKREVIAK